MNERELYRQKKQAQLDEWQADLDKLKAKASQTSADAKIAMNKQISALEARLDEGRVKLSQLEKASEEAWGSIKEGVETAWDSLKSGFKDAASKLSM